METRNQWKTTAGFLFAAIGSAVGLGNIWRFSYLTYQYGGGAFLIPYFIALITVGVPLLILEYGLGHEKESSAPMAFAKVGHQYEWIGWWAVTFVMFGIVLYYIVVIGWALNYLVFSFKLSWGGDTNSFFYGKFLALTKGPSVIGNIRPGILISVAVIWFLNWIIVYNGVEKGIEKANKIFMPLLFLITVLLVIWGLTLPGAGAGIKTYLKPNFAILKSREVWIAAFGQIFFTLSLGFGIMIAYASYLPRKTNIVKNAFITSFANSGYSFLAGFAVFSALGYMAHTTGLPVNKVVDKSIGLAFVTYPKIISSLPFLKSLFGVLFFGMLVIAGLSSSISIVEAFTSAIIDKFHWNRKKVVTVISLLGFSGSLIFTTQGGLFWLDIVDHFLNSFGLIVVGLLEAFIIGWLYKASTLRKHINRSIADSQMILGKWWDWSIKVVIPFILGFILIKSFLGETAQPYGGYKWKEVLLIGRDWLYYTLFAAVILSMIKRTVNYNK